MTDEQDVIATEREMLIKGILTYLQNQDTLDERVQLKQNMDEIIENKTVSFKFSTPDVTAVIYVEGTKKAINTYYIDRIILETIRSGISAKRVLTYDEGRMAIQGLKMLLYEHNYDVNIYKNIPDPYR